MDEEKKCRMTHLDSRGRPRMVDVSGKEPSLRTATACGIITFSRDVAELMDGSGPKGDPLTTAVLAGIQAVKRTPELIPLCHSLSAEHIDLDFSRRGTGELEATCTVTGRGPTGFEMEAMVGVTVALLTVYDMAKAVDRSMVLGEVRLTGKTGGRSGHVTGEV